MGSRRISEKDYRVELADGDQGAELLVTRQGRISLIQSAVDKQQGQIDMKPLNDSNQSKRMLRWFRYGSAIGFLLALTKLLMLDGGTSLSWADVDGLVLNAISFAMIILLAGAAGGLMAMFANWMKR